MLIKDETICVNNGKNYLYIGNYNGKENMNLEFCVNDEKIYLSIKNKMTIYKQSYESKDEDIIRRKVEVEIFQIDKILQYLVITNIIPYMIVICDIF